MSRLSKRLVSFLLTLVIMLSTVMSISIPAFAADETYINSLVAKGFPRDYAVLLEQVHQKHPNWTFTPLVTGINFDDAVAGESKNGLCTTDVDISYFLLLTRDRGTYNSNGTYTYIIVDGNQAKQTGHADASDLCISYFMDPRNFVLEDRTIFQFVNMAYPSDDTGLRESVEAATTGTFLASHVNQLMASGQAYSVNPVYLVAKIIQEVGSDGSNTAVSGKASGYEGYYNCFNIGAYADSSGTAVINGLKRAKSEGWTSIDKSIDGGAKFIANGYTAVGQHTPYLTKFNVNPKNTSFSLYTHQYMSAIYDPAQSARTIYNAYKTANILDTVVDFVIPVFSNMPNFTRTSIKLNDTSNSAVAKEPSASNFYVRSTPSYAAPSKTLVPSNTNVTIEDRVRSIDLATDSAALYHFQIQYPFWYKIKYGTSTGYTAFENVPNTSSVTMKIGESRTFKYTLSVAADNSVRFESLDPRIATVDIKTGAVVAKSLGTTQIIAYTASGSVDYVNLTVVNATGTPTSLTSSGFTINQSTGIASQISIGTTVSTLLSKVNEKAYAAVYKNGVKQGNDVKLATGMTLGLVINGNVVKQYSIAVTGDTNCDGSLGPGDAVCVLRHLSGIQPLSGAALIAADSNKDGGYGPGDAVTILKSIG